MSYQECGFRVERPQSRTTDPTSREVTEGRGRLRGSGSSENWDIVDERPFRVYQTGTRTFRVRNPFLDTQYPLGVCLKPRGIDTPREERSRDRTSKENEINEVWD